MNTLKLDDVVKDLFGNSIVIEERDTQIELTYRRALISILLAGEAKDKYHTFKIASLVSSVDELKSSHITESYEAICDHIKTNATTLVCGRLVEFLEQVKAQ